MTPTDLYAHQAEALANATRLVPQAIRHDGTRGTSTFPLQLFPPHGEARVVGIRLFHRPREIVIDKIVRREVQLVGPVDAAAYAADGPLPPLQWREPAKEYRGEMLRFVAVDWGTISRVEPLDVYLHGWEDPRVQTPEPSTPTLQGYLVLDPLPVNRFNRPVGGFFPRRSGNR